MNKKINRESDFINLQIFDPKALSGFSIANSIASTDFKKQREFIQKIYQRLVRPPVLNIRIKFENEKMNDERRKMKNRNSKQNSCAGNLSK